MAKCSECWEMDGSSVIALTRKKRMCHIRGKMRKRVWVNQGDIILIGLRDFQDDKADVILKYNADEARQLKKIGAIPPETNIEEGEKKEGDDDVPFDFTGAIKDSDGDDDDADVGTQPDRYKDLPEFSESDEDDDEIDLAAL